MNNTPLEQFLSVLHKLEKRDRDIAQLRYLCGYSYAEIERMTHIPHTTVARRLRVLPAIIQLLLTKEVV